MAKGPSQKSNIITYAIVGVFFLVIVAIIYREPIRNLFEGDGEKQALQASKSEDANDTNKILEMIQNAQKSGDDERYQDAITTLEDALALKPGNEEQGKIDNLLAKYKEEKEKQDQIVEDDRIANDTTKSSDEDTDSSTEAMNTTDSDTKSESPTAIDKDKELLVQTDTKSEQVIQPQKAKKRGKRKRYVRKTRRNKKHRKAKIKQRLIKERVYYYTEKTEQYLKASFPKSQELTLPTAKGIAYNDSGFDSDYESAKKSSKIDNGLKIVSRDSDEMGDEDRMEEAVSREVEPLKAALLTESEKVAVKGDGNRLAEGKREGELDATDKSFPVPKLDDGSLEEGSFFGANAIDKLIKLAKKLGARGRFSEAVVKLNEAKSNDDPEPTDNQIQEIDELLGKYGSSLIDRQIDLAEKTGDGGKPKEAKDLLVKLKNQTAPSPTDEQDQRIDVLLEKYTKAFDKWQNDQNKKLADELFRKGLIELKDGNNDEAIRLFDEALKHYPDHVLAHSYKGTAYHRNKQDEEAMLASDEALKRQEDEPNAHFTKGEIFYGKYKDREAEQEFAQVIEKDKKNAYAFFKLGVLKLLGGRNKEGLILFEKALAVDPDGLNDKYQRNAHYNKGVANERIRKFDDAERNYRKAIDLDGKYTKAYIQLGEVYYKRKDYDRAAQALTEGLDSSPNNYDLTFLLGKTYDTMADKNRVPEQYNSALLYYKKAHELNPKSFEALYNTGNVYLKKKDHNEAINYFKQAAEIDSDDYALNADFGAAYLGLKEYDKSIEYYEKARDNDPERIDAYIGLAGVYFARSKKADGSRDEEAMQKVVENLEKVNGINSKIFEVNKTLGTAYFALKQNEKAREALEKAVSLKPKNAVARRNLATVYFANKDFEKAADHFEKAVERKDNDPILYQRLGECYFKLEKNEKAKEWFEKLVNKFPEYKNKRKIRFYLRAVGSEL